MTIDINWLEMSPSTKFDLFYLWCTSRLTAVIIALWHFWPLAVAVCLRCRKPSDSTERQFLSSKSDTAKPKLNEVNAEHRLPTMHLHVSK